MKVYPKKKVAYSFLPYVGAFLYLAVLLFGTVALCAGNIYCLGATFGVVIILVMLNYCFSWYKYYEIVTGFGSSPGSFNLVVYDVLAILGNNKVTYTIVTPIEKLKRCKNGFVL